MNHKILEQIKGGGFLAGDLPTSTSSYYYHAICSIIFIVSIIIHTHIALFSYISHDLAAFSLDFQIFLDFA